jgi:hypothetical protein
VHLRRLGRKRDKQVWRRTEASSNPVRDETRSFSTGLELASVTQPMTGATPEAVAMQIQLRAPPVTTRTAKPRARFAVVARRSRQDDDFSVWLPRVRHIRKDQTIRVDPNIDATKRPASTVPSPRSARTSLTTLSVAMQDAHVDGGAIVASMAPPSLA